MIVPVIPTRGLIFARTLQSLQESPLLEPPIIIEGLPIPDCHNEAVERALAKQPSHILMVEDDMVLPSGAVEAMLDAGAAVACIDYPVGNGHRTIYPERNQCGLGCTLIQSRVFEHLPRPWFETDRSLTPDGRILDTPYVYGGQDVWFGRKLREMGITITPIEGWEAQHLRCTELQRIEYNNGTYNIKALPALTQEDNE